MKTLMSKRTWSVACAGIGLAFVAGAAAAVLSGELGHALMLNACAAVWLWLPLQACR